MHALFVENPRLLFVEKTQQDIRRLQRRADQFKIIDGIEQDIHAVPVLHLVVAQQIGGLQYIARPFTLCGKWRRFGHLLEHHATRAPMLCLVNRCRFAKAQLEAGRQLLGLREICLGRLRQRFRRER